ncbi:hypothetical protein A3A79_02250 [Candidatus Gottesmanbacteria bacterium RIFCSPLOWO2_01_FULL_43_11b]|uniref:Uncharacterized protein n=1 Tax=Candidatus Gottesmanbacteria bacterium RIFCSPLOWO2_01_FULL_43_11b TaxID=1798392 RepID=A0A1F6AH35_9BACT|nr:MAG: hypothetical protein A3A79_02250 [Candidatus Gottesmanbacteria bacterium RIFCSPLOWO2_01_FULL_43_11b]
MKRFLEGLTGLEDRILEGFGKFNDMLSRPLMRATKFLETHDPMEASDKLGITLQIDTYTQALGEGIVYHNISGGGPLAEIAHQESDGKAHDVLVKWVSEQVEIRTHLEPSDKNARYARWLSTHMVKGLLGQVSQKKNDHVNNEVILTARSIFLNGVYLSDSLSSKSVDSIWRHQTQKLFSFNYANIKELQSRMKTFIDEPPLSTS